MIVSVIEIGWEGGHVLMRCCNAFLAALYTLILRFMHLMLLSICDFRENHHKEDRAFLLTWWHQACLYRSTVAAWVRMNPASQTASFANFY